jgi:hypothetical protein
VKYADANQIRDALLISRAINGDITAFEFLADDFCHKVFSVLYPRLERVDCRDCLQTFHHVCGSGFEFREHPFMRFTHLVEHLPVQTCLLELFFGEAMAPEKISPALGQKISPPLGQRRVSPPGSRMSDFSWRNSHVLAIFQSRITVSGATCSTSAVSSTLKPPK